MSIFKINEIDNLKFTSYSFSYNNVNYFSGTLINTSGVTYFNLHYGIYIGNINNEIMILHNDKEGVIITSIDKFVRTENYITIVYPIYEFNQELFDQLIQRAKEFSKQKFNTYKNNCEHFVTYLLFKKKRSIQSIYLETLIEILNLPFDLATLDPKNIALKNKHRKLKYRLLKILG